MSPFCASVWPSVNIFVSGAHLGNLCGGGEGISSILHTHIPHTHPLVGVDVPFGGYDLDLQLSAKIALFIKSPPTMWWRLIVLVLSIFVMLIIIIIQQFEDVNALQSPIFI